MNFIDYQHPTPPSFLSKLIQISMRLFGMKKKMEKKMIYSDFEKNPAKLPKSISHNFNVVENIQSSRKVWTISQKEFSTEVVILYLHGGAYVANISAQHWDLIKLLLTKTKAQIIIPDYPLAPEATHKETYEFMEELYSKCLLEYASKHIVFIGDSAGGGLALGFAQQLKNSNIKLPKEIILFSPWLDITMSNPDLEWTAKNDQLLSVAGLKSAGQKYGGNTDLKDFRLSPLYGNFKGLCRISIFFGTNDILVADVRKLKQMLKDQQYNINYFEYPSMFHAWVIITRLTETQDVINKVERIIFDDIH